MVLTTVDGQIHSRTTRSSEIGEILHCAMNWKFSRASLTPLMTVSWYILLTNCQQYKLIILWCSSWQLLTLGRRQREGEGAGRNVVAVARNARNFRMPRAIISQVRYLRFLTTASLSRIAEENEREYRYSEIIWGETKSRSFALYSVLRGTRKWNIKDSFWNFNLWFPAGE